MSWSDLASKYHPQFADAMKNYEDCVLARKEIIKIMIEKFPDLEGKEDWLLPSDHCINHPHKGACYCEDTKSAIFERLGHGIYRVLPAKHLPY